MKHFIKILSYSAWLLLVAGLMTGCKSDDSQSEQSRPSTKRERNLMKEGKNLYDKQRYAEAEVSFTKALEENGDNQRAKFNLASTYLKQRGEDMANQGDSLIAQADRILAETSQSTDIELAQLSFYDRGNIAYKKEDYAGAIEMYKQALRRNPEDNQARQNLRLAQLKKQEQDQNEDKQDQNQDQNQDKDQQQQDQKQDQQQQDQQDQQQDQQQQQQQQGGMSEQNAAQILKAMDDKESQTRMKVKKMKQDQEKQSRQRQTAKPW